VNDEELNQVHEAMVGITDEIMINAGRAETLDQVHTMVRQATHRLLHDMTNDDLDFLMLSILSILEERRS
jgi:hypothetical protein